MNIFRFALIEHQLRKSKQMMCSTVRGTLFLSLHRQRVLLAIEFNERKQKVLSGLEGSTRGPSLLSAKHGASI